MEGRTSRVSDNYSNSLYPADSVESEEESQSKRRPERRSPGKKTINNNKKRNRHHKSPDKASSITICTTAAMTGALRGSKKKETETGILEHEKYMRLSKDLTCRIENYFLSDKYIKLGDEEKEKKLKLLIDALSNNNETLEENTERVMDQLSSLNSERKNPACKRLIFPRKKACGETPFNSQVEPISKNQKNFSDSDPGSGSPPSTDSASAVSLDSFGVSDEFSEDANSPTLPKKELKPVFPPIRLVTPNVIPSLRKTADAMSDSGNSRSIHCITVKNISESMEIIQKKDIQKSALAESLKNIMNAKSGGADQGAGNNENEKRKSHILKGISESMNRVSNLISRGRFVYKEDRDQILLLKAKIKAYPEELHKVSDILIPFIIGGMLTLLCALGCHIFLPGGALLYGIAATAGFAAGKNISLTPFLQNKFRSLISSFLSLFVYVCYHPLIGKPYDNFISLTKQDSFSETGVEHTAILCKNEEKDDKDNGELKKSHEKNGSAESKINQGDEPSPRTVDIPTRNEKEIEYRKINKEVKTFYNDKRPIAVDSNSPASPSTKKELDGLEKAITFFLQDHKFLEDNANLYREFHGLYKKLSERHAQLKNEETTIKKEKYIKKVTRQTRLCLEALFLPNNDEDKLNHFLLLQVKAASDPEEYHWIVQFICPLLAAGILSVLCVYFAHSIILVSLLIDLVAGAFLASKESALDVVASPTASKMMFDYLSHRFFSNPVHDGISSIGNHITSQSLITKPDCRAFLIGR